MFHAFLFTTFYNQKKIIMLCVPLAKAILKYDLHPYVLLNRIDREQTNGSHIGNNWYVDETIIQEYIVERHLIFESSESILFRCLKEKEEIIYKELVKVILMLFILCSLVNYDYSNFLI